MGADKSAENTPNFQPNLSVQAQQFGIQIKKASLTLRSLCFGRKFTQTLNHVWCYWTHGYPINPNKKVSSKTFLPHCESERRATSRAAFSVLNSNYRQGAGCTRELRRFMYTVQRSKFLIIMSKHFVKGSFVAKIFMRLHLNLYTAYISQYFLSRVKKKSEWKAFQLIFFSLKKYTTVHIF